VPAYHQFCPVAKAMELLDERWTLLVVRELVTGSQHFNALRRGLPRMSPSLLSKRLQQLTRAGVVERTDDGRYVLTAAGEELRPVVEALGGWGVRWIGELGDADLDPQLLLWDMHRNVDHAAVPPTQTVVRFHFPDAEPCAPRPVALDQARRRLRRRPWPARHRHDHRGPGDDGADLAR
jgi:DNA-binding HxlR family transcriptional regulator